jgi:putative phosphoesterase
MEIGIISDTHGYLDPRVFKAFDNCDEIWHAGDFGTLEIAQELADFRPFRGVYGNIDDANLRLEYPENQRFKCEGVDVWMTHIAGSQPGRYPKRVREGLQESSPQVLICGHSHLLHVENDKKYGLKYVNPGAAGHEGHHIMRTILKAEFSDGEMKNLRLIELGPRGRRQPKKESS